MCARLALAVLGCIGVASAALVTDSALLTLETELRQLYDSHQDASFVAAGRFGENYRVADYEKDEHRNSALPDDIDYTIGNANHSDVLEQVVTSKRLLAEALQQRAAGPAMNALAPARASQKLLQYALAHRRNDDNSTTQDEILSLLAVSHRLLLDAGGLGDTLAASSADGGISATRQQRVAQSIRRAEAAAQLGQLNVADQLLESFFRVAQTAVLSSDTGAHAEAGETQVVSGHVYNRSLGAALVPSSTDMDSQLLLTGFLVGAEQHRLSGRYSAAEAMLTRAGSLLTAAYAERSVTQGTRGAAASSLLANASCKHDCDATAAAAAPAAASTAMDTHTCALADVLLHASVLAAARKGAASPVTRLALRSADRVAFRAAAGKCPWSTFSAFLSAVKLLEADNTTAVGAQVSAQQAEAILRRLLDDDAALLGTSHPAYAGSLVAHGASLLECGRHADALTVLQVAQTVLYSALGPKHAFGSLVRIHAVLAEAEALHALGRHHESLRSLADAATAAEGSLGPRHPLTATAAGRIALQTEAIALSHFASGCDDVMASAEDAGEEGDNERANASQRAQDVLRTAASGAAAAAAAAAEQRAPFVPTPVRHCREAAANAAARVSWPHYEAARAAWSGVEEKRDNRDFAIFTRSYALAAFRVSVGDRLTALDSALLPTALAHVSYARQQPSAHMLSTLLLVEALQQLGDHAGAVAELSRATSVVAGALGARAVPAAFAAIPAAGGLNTSSAPSSHSYEMDVPLPSSAHLQDWYAWLLQRSVRVLRLAAGGGKRLQGSGSRAVAARGLAATALPTIPPHTDDGSGGGSHSGSGSGSSSGVSGDEDGAAAIAASLTPASASGAPHLSLCPAQRRQDLAGFVALEAMTLRAWLAAAADKQSKAVVSASGSSALPLLAVLHTAATRATNKTLHAAAHAGLSYTPSASAHSVVDDLARFPAPATTSAGHDAPSHRAVNVIVQQSGTAAATAAAAGSPAQASEGSSILGWLGWRSEGRAVQAADGAQATEAAQPTGGPAAAHATTDPARVVSRLQRQLGLPDAVVVEAQAVVNKSRAAASSAGSGSGSGSGSGAAATGTGQGSGATSGTTAGAHKAAKIKKDKRGKATATPAAAAPAVPVTQPVHASVRQLSSHDPAVQRLSEFLLRQGMGIYGCTFAQPTAAPDRPQDPAAAAAAAAAALASPLLNVQVRCGSAHPAAPLAFVEMFNPAGFEHPMRIEMLTKKGEAYLEQLLQDVAAAQAAGVEWQIKLAETPAELTGRAARYATKVGMPIIVTRSLDAGSKGNSLPAGAAAGAPQSPPPQQLPVAPHLLPRAPGLYLDELLQWSSSMYGYDLAALRSAFSAGGAAGRGIEDVLGWHPPLVPLDELARISAERERRTKAA